MLITLYSCNADRKQCDKTSFLTAIATVNAKPTKAFNAFSPSFSLDYNENWVNANYCYIHSPLNKYYFLSSPNLEIGKKIEFAGSEDVLFSWYNYYKDKEAIILRSESIGKPSYIPDNSLPVNPVAFEMESIKFSSSPFIGNGRSYILTTLGGGR